MTRTLLVQPPVPEAVWRIGTWSRARLRYGVDGQKMGEGGEFKLSVFPKI